MLRELKEGSKRCGLPTINKTKIITARNVIIDYEIVEHVNRYTYLRQPLKLSD